MSYDNFAHTFSESRKNHPWPELNCIIEDMKRQGFSNVLDIGCGNGRFLEEADKAELHIEHYLWIDSSTGMIAEARKLHREYHFEVAPMESLSNCQTVKLSNYDAIIFLASFHHLESREERLTVLEDIKLFLKPGGRVYMTNWNLRDQSRYQKSHQGNGDYDIKIGEFSRYYHGFTVEELNELFDTTWWNVVENKIFEGGRNIVSILMLA